MIENIHRIPHIRQDRWKMPHPEIWHPWGTGKHIRHTRCRHPGRYIGGEGPGFQQRNCLLTKQTRTVLLLQGPKSGPSIPGLPASKDGGQDLPGPGAGAIIHGHLLKIRNATLVRTQAAAQIRLKAIIFSRCQRHCRSCPRCENSFGFRCRRQRAPPSPYPADPCWSGLPRQP